MNASLQVEVTPEGMAQLVIKNLNGLRLLTIPFSKVQIKELSDAALRAVAMINEIEKKKGL